MGKSYKKVCIFSLTNISRTIILSPALVFDAFRAKSIRRPSDMNQFSSQTICPDTNGLAIALLSAGIVFLI